MKTKKKEDEFERLIDRATDMILKDTDVWKSNEKKWPKKRRR